MKKKIVLIRVLLLVALLPQLAKAQFAGGTGTSEDPFLISNPQHLLNVNNFNDVADMYFSVTNDIDLTEFLEENYPETGWPGIGEYNHEFKGYFNGNNHTITGLWIASPGQRNDRGLFRASYGRIENCILKDVTISNVGNTVGGFVGLMRKGAIVNCHVTNVSISLAGIQCGGFVGRVDAFSADPCTIQNCSVANVTIQAGEKTGGFVGDVNANKATSTITNCSVMDVSITSTAKSCGGFAGQIYRTKTQATGCSVIRADITSTAPFDNYGGFAGNVDMNGDDCSVIVSDCHISGISMTNVGTNSAGFIGRLTNKDSNTGTIENCSAEGKLSGYVSGGTYGGFVAWHNSKEIRNCNAHFIVETASKIVGGFVGAHEGYGQITNGFFSGTVKGNDIVGGFAGQARRPIAHCHAIAEVTGGSEAVGGFIGLSSDQGTNPITITSSSFQGKVVGIGTGTTSAVGGFIGKNNTGTAASHNQCYAHADIVATNDNLIGGFVGSVIVNAPYIEESYFYGSIQAPQTATTGAFAGVNEGDEYTLFDVYARKIDGLNLVGAGTIASESFLLTDSEMKTPGSYYVNWFTGGAWTNTPSVTFPYLKTQSSPAAIHSLSATQLTLELETTPEAVFVYKNYRLIDMDDEVNGTFWTGTFNESLTDGDLITVSVKETGKRNSYAVSKPYSIGSNLSDISVNAQVVVYPNPATEVLNIKSRSEIQSVEIISLTGQVLHKEACFSDAVQLPVNTLKAGLYLVRTVTNEGIFTQEMIKK